MATTKYLVDNLSDQTLDGNLRINGNLIVSPDGTHSIGTYRALLSQKVFSGTSLDDFKNSLIPGELYTITNYNAGDDFSNIGQLVTGTMNTTGCEFIATASTPPLSWYYSSTLTSAGNLQVEVLENTLGYDIDWTHEENFIGPGLYIGVKSTPQGPVHNDFNRRNISAMISQPYLLSSITPIGPVTQFIGPGYYTGKDDTIFIYNFDYDSYAGIDDYLFYSAVEIKVKQNLDTTPIIVSGIIDEVYPFNSVSIEFFDNGVSIVTISCIDNSNVADDDDLIGRLNNDPATSFLGTFSISNGDIIVEMPTNIKKQFSEGQGVLTIRVYED